MLITITLTLSFLVAINFLLLKFSSNKVVRSERKSEKPVVLKPETTVKSISARLAPTGS